MRRLLTTCGIWRKVMQKPDCTRPLPSTAPEINSFVTLALMNLNNLYSFIYLGGREQTPLILWSIMNISSFVSCSETTEFTFISLSALLSSGERFLNPNSVFDHSIMNILPACWRWKMTTLMINSWVATLACSPGMGVGVLECSGVCTKGFKHSNQLESSPHADI